MLKWLKNLLLGPEMTHEETVAAMLCTESTVGAKVFHMDGDAAFRLIKEHGFPVRGDDEHRFVN